MTPEGVAFGLLAVAFGCGLLLLRALTGSWRAGPRARHEERLNTHRPTNGVQAVDTKEGRRR